MAKVSNFSNWLFRGFFRLRIGSYTVEEYTGLEIVTQGKGFVLSGWFSTFKRPRRLRDTKGFLFAIVLLAFVLLTLTLTLVLRILRVFRGFRGLFLAPGLLIVGL